MRRLARSSCLAAIVLCAACDVSTSEESADEGIASAAAALELPPTPAEACLDDRYVGVTTTGACPGTVGNVNGIWKGEPGFNGALEPALASYCVYQWSPASPVPPATTPPPPDPSILPAMGGQPPAVWLARDCHVSAPLAGIDDMRTQVRGELLGERDAHLGLVGARTKGPRASVRVAVIDTSPTSPERVPVRGANQHGHDVARVVEDIACGDNQAMTCAVEVPTELGLPRSAPKVVDEINGGWFGTQLDVARAIYRAVAAWRIADPKKRPRHLLLNLSLGWQGELGGPIAAGSDERSLPGPVRSAYESLRFASCSDALVIVAAGNDPGGPTRSAGAMYPAGWEQHPAPSVIECETLFGKGTKPSTAGLYTPLVHAVAAVDAKDQASATSRPSGRPRMVAPGVQIVARVEKDTVVATPAGNVLAPATEFTSPRTGSSMAAATTSGAAALLWSMRPSLTKHEVMDEVWKSAQPTGTAADFSLASSPPEVARLDVCNLVQRACVFPGVCLGAPTCASRAIGSGRLFAMSAGAATSVRSAFSTAPLLPLTLDLVTEHHADRCGTSAIALGADAAEEPCVDRTYFGEASVPFALPQPSGNGDPEIWGIVTNPAIIVGNPPSQLGIFIDRVAARDYVLDDTTLIMTVARERTTYALGVAVPSGDGNLRLTFSTRHVTREKLDDVSVAFTLAGSRRTVVTAPVTLAFETR